MYQKKNPQIKNLNKQAKNYADYDDLKQKLGEAEKDKLAHGEQIKKIKKDFAWSPKYGLEEIVKSAYLWHKNHPCGYAIMD